MLQNKYRTLLFVLFNNYFITNNYYEVTNNPEWSNQIIKKTAQIKKRNFQKIEILIFNGKIFIFSSQLDFLRHLIPLTCENYDLKKSCFFCFFLIFGYFLNNLSFIPYISACFNKMAYPTYQNVDNYLIYLNMK